MSSAYQIRVNHMKSFFEAELSMIAELRSIKPQPINPALSTVDYGSPKATGLPRFNEPRTPLSPGGIRIPNTSCVVNKRTHKKPKGEQETSSQYRSNTRL